MIIKSPSISILVVVMLLVPGCATSELCVPNVHTVVAGVLVRGGQPNESGFLALQKTYGIHTVVNLNDATATCEGPMVTRLGMRYVPLPCNPFSPDAKKFLAFLEVVQNSRNAPVYVHCKDGMDRTGMAVAVYRIVVQGWSADRAMRDLHAHQEFTHTLLFLDIPFFVRDVAKHRHQWEDARKSSARGHAPNATARIN